MQLASLAMLNATFFVISKHCGHVTYFFTVWILENRENPDFSLLAPSLPARPGKPWDPFGPDGPVVPVPGIPLKGLSKFKNKRARAHTNCPNI